MIDRIKLQLALSSLTSELDTLRNAIDDCGECRALLRQTIDRVCSLITDRDYRAYWQRWSEHESVRCLAEVLRESVVNTLCALEKHHAQQIRKSSADACAYLGILGEGTRAEWLASGIDANARVLFVGAGAMPTSAMLLAREAGAEVCCHDIDPEAIELAREVVTHAGLSDQIHCSADPIPINRFTPVATHVVVASLVRHKSAILDQLARHMPAHARIVLRYGEGIRVLFNYPLDQPLSPIWRVTCITQPHAVYDTAILERRDHAH